MSDQYPSRVAEKIVIRLPDGMRDRLAALAKANKRSVNAEVVARLEATLDPGPDDYVPKTEEDLKTVVLMFERYMRFSMKRTRGELPSKDDGSDEPGRAGEGDVGAS